MEKFHEIMPIHRSIFGAKITQILAEEVARIEEVQEGYTMFLMENEIFSKILFTHYDRLPGRNFGDLMDGLEFEMKFYLDSQQVEVDAEVVEEEVPFWEFPEDMNNTNVNG